MTTDLATSMTMEMVQKEIQGIEKGIIFNRASASWLGLKIVDLDERMGWVLFKNDDGTPRYSSVVRCLVSELSDKLDVTPEQIRRYIRHAQMELQLFGRDVEGDVKIIMDPRFKRPALPERTGRELARLNKWPDKQQAAWDKLMEATDGRPTAKVAKKVVDTFDGTFQRKRSERREVIHDPQLKKVALMLIGSVDDHIRLAEEKKAPSWVVSKLVEARKSIEKWKNMIRG